MRRCFHPDVHMAPTEAWRKQNVLVAPSVVQDLCPLRSDLLFITGVVAQFARLHPAIVCCSLKKKARLFRWNSTWQSRCKSLTMQKQSPKLPWVLLPWDEVLLPDEAAKKPTRNADGTEVVKLLCNVFRLMGLQWMIMIINKFIYITDPWNRFVSPQYAFALQFLHFCFPIIGNTNYFSQ